MSSKASHPILFIRRYTRLSWLHFESEASEEPSCDRISHAACCTALWLQNTTLLAHSASTLVFILLCLTALHHCPITCKSYICCACEGHKTLFLPLLKASLQGHFLQGCTLRSPHLTNCLSLGVSSAQGGTAAVFPLPIIQSVLCQMFTSICLAHIPKTTAPYRSSPYTG